MVLGAIATLIARGEEIHSWKKYRITKLFLRLEIDNYMPKMLIVTKTNLSQVTDNAHSMYSPFGQ